MSDEKIEWESKTAFVWTVEDVARELKVSVSHVYRLTSQNKIPYAKVGKTLRFFPTQIEEWLKRGGSR